SRVVDPVAPELRVQELIAFQGWMDLVGSITPAPVLTRAQVLTQNYICFAYLGDAVFMMLRKCSSKNTTTRRVSEFLTDNPVRAFRNAVAHGNWHYAN